MAQPKADKKADTKADTKATPDTAQANVADDPTEPGISSWTFENIAEHIAKENDYSLATAPAEFWVSVGMKAAQLHYAGECAAAMGAEMARQALQGHGPLSHDSVEALHLGGMAEESFRTTADLPEANKEDGQDDGKEDAPF